MKPNFIAIMAGLMFSAGLVLSGMVAPKNIIDFLDVAGTWNPSLAIVLASAVVTYFIAYRLIIKRRTPVFSEKFQVPSKTKLDIPLLIGPVIFGAGWGLSGYCPAPALVSLFSGAVAPVIFIGAMIAGFYSYDLFEKLRS